LEGFPDFASQHIYEKVFSVIGQFVKGDFPLDNERVAWEKVAQGLGIRWKEAKSLLVKTTISYLNEFLKLLRVVAAQRFNC